MKIKNFFAILLILVLVSIGVSAQTVPIDNIELEIDGTQVDDIITNPLTKYDVERAQVIDLDIEFEATGDTDDLQISAFILDYDDAEVIEIPQFDIVSGSTYSKSTEYHIPIKIPTGDYTLRINFSDDVNDEVIKDYALHISAPRHFIYIEDIFFSEGTYMQPGQPLFVKFLLANYGSSDEDDIEITVSIPDLGLQTTGDIDEIEAEDLDSSKEFYLGIPISAEAGTYDLEFEIEYNDGDNTISGTRQINVYTDCTPPSFDYSSIIDDYDEIEIDDFDFDDEIYSGTFVIFSPTLENVGTEDEEHIKIFIYIPELGFTGSDYVARVWEGDDVRTSDFYFFIPSCVEPGTYDVYFRVENSDQTKILSEQYELTVLERLDKLAITDLDVIVDGQTADNLADSDNIPYVAHPGSEIDLDVELQNLYNATEDIEMELIGLSAYLESIFPPVGDAELLFYLGPEEKVREDLEFNIPLDLEEGIYDVDLLALALDEDGFEHEVQWTLTLEVETISTSNQPPQITSSAPTSVTLNQTYSYDVEATDPDGDNVTFSLPVKPSGMSIDTASGLIQWNPAATGNFDVTVNATDDYGLASSQSFTINVATPRMLEIIDLDVKVDGDTSKNLNDGDKISKEAAPGSDVNFDIEIKNLFDDDMDIEDIDITVTIKDIDDGDNIDEEKTVDKLKPRKKESVSISLDIPVDAEEDTFDVTIDVEGRDEDDNIHEVTWDLTLEVDRERHKLIITDLDLSPSTLVCQRTSSLTLEIVNVGSNDEEADLRIENDELELLFTVNNIDLEEDPDDDDNEYQKEFIIQLDDSVKAGTYPIDVTVRYDDGDEKLEETLNLEVRDCTIGPVVEEDEDTTPVVIVQPDTTPTAPSAKKKQKTTEISIFSSEYIFLIIIAIVIAAGLIIFTMMYVILKINR